jgi:oxygen-independent coproporphyrinogen III oxidase
VNAGELPLQRGHVLNEEDLAIRSLLWTLMAGAPADVGDTDRQSPWWQELRKALEPLARDGLVELSGRRLAVTGAGRAFLPRIGLAFDRHLRQAKAA